MHHASVSNASNRSSSSNRGHTSPTAGSSGELSPVAIVSVPGYATVTMNACRPLSA